MEVDKTMVFSLKLALWNAAHLRHLLSGQVELALINQLPHISFNQLPHISFHTSTSLCQGRYICTTKASRSMMLEEHQHPAFAQGLTNRACRRKFICLQSVLCTGSLAVLHIMNR